MIGPFLDATDGVTAETALTIAQSDRMISKSGAAFSQSSTTGNLTHDADGWYPATLSTTDTNTVGALTLQVVVAGAGPVWHTWYVVEESVFDAYFDSGSAGEVNEAASEVSSVPAANASISDKVSWLFAIFRNKTQTDATSFTVRNDGDTADIGSQTLSSDGTTLTREKAT